MKRKDAYGLTLMRTKFLRDSGYTVVEKWEHEKPAPWETASCPERQTATYPHAIVYDFEAYQDTSKAERPTPNLFYESEHVPISVSIADTLNPEPEYIVSRDPNELIYLFYQSLERRHEAIVADVVTQFRFSGLDGITEKQDAEIVKWLTQVPVLGFNSGHYDLKLIRQYFIPLMARGKDVFAAEKNGRIMFINTPKFKFLDVLNYLAPGITYDKWVKTYGATLTKSWLPYEWFDSPAKLDFPGLPPYMAWYSKLKGEYVLTLKEYDDCHRVFRERGMRTFGDWLEYYNNLDVAPFLEALQKMKEFYTDLGVDIFKDAVSLPGVSEKYILRKTLQPRRGYKPPELYAPNAEAYAMLKAAVVGGPSLVFTRKHVAGETRIRSHQYEDARLCRRILGYDANWLYPSTMMKEMPCGPGHITTYNNPMAAALVLPQLIGTKQWFGFAEVDIEVPRELWPDFEEFPPLFINRSIPDNLVPQHMRDYLRQSGRKRFPEQQKLLGVLSAKKILLYAPLLEWYLNNGLKVTAVYRTIDYKPREIFSWFVNEVADNRRKGDADKDKALLAEVFKLLGNSAYGKFIEAVERQNRALYTSNEEEVDKYLRSAWFQDLDEIGDSYKIELRKSKIDITRPFQVGIVVYQLAKAPYAPVLLRVPGLLLRAAGLRAHPDGHGQHVLRIFPREARGRRPAWVRGPVRGEQKAMVGLGQVEQPRAWSVQAREAGHLRHRPVQQVFLHGGQGHRPGKGLFQGGQQAPERDACRAFRAGPRGQSRHGNQPGLPHAQRRDVHVRAAQARPERVLRQALGVGGRYPHGADRVPPVVSYL